MRVCHRTWFTAILLVVLASVTIGAGLSATAEEKSWNFVPAKQIGAVDFRTQQPTWDGRGVVIAILDTGVDVHAPGMLQTSTGLTKVIDVRDFSTQGDWETFPAERADESTAGAPVFQTEDGLQLRGAGQLPVPPHGEDEADHPVYIGTIAEHQFVDSDAVYDLNDDGDNSDEFGFLVYVADRAAVEEALGVGRGYEMMMELNETAAATVAAERAAERVWLVVVDTDGNGDLADETVLRDYHVNYDSFALGNANSPDSRALMSWEVNVKANEDYLGKALSPTVEFHFDDGAHGSHCSGIAAGFNVSGQEGLHGGAPGAWIMSLKLGDNRLAGGATRTSSMKKCYEYAAAFEERWGIPVVVNMSFGIASVEEGEDAMGEWLNDLLAEHPTLYVCTSAGNAGPGLSTVGLPATAYSLISSGASLAPETAADLYNARIARHTLFNFSSRGGEAAKPDVVAPGSALSTVPGYVDGMARFNGTSMASPQTAGGVACLVSAALQEDLPIHWGMVKRALIAGGTLLEEQRLVDQGGGLVNVPASWPVLEKLARSESAHQVLWYDIETPCAFQADGMSEAAYWRTPGGTPFSPEKVSFTVRPVFHPDLGPDERDTFFRSFNFKSEVDWLKIVSGDRYIRGDMGMTVTCRYDENKLQEMGAHSARIIATLDGGDVGGLAGREFYLWNTVVIGDDFDNASGFMRTYEGKDLAQSSAHHYYVNVPTGATAMRVRLEVSKDVGSKADAAALIEINDPEGNVRGGFSGYATPDDNPIRTTTVLAPELRAGTWEINIAGGIRSLDLTDYSLTVSFDGYAAEPAELTGIKRSDNGKPAKGKVTVTRLLPGVFRGDVSAAIEGFVREQEIEINETDTWEHSFTLDTDTPRAHFDLVMTEKVANLFTDCAVNILDSSSKALVATGFDGREVGIGIRLPAGQDKASYTLKVVGAFAIAEDMADWGFDLEEQFYFAEPVSGTVKRAGGGALRLYCGVPTDLKVSFADGWPEPAGDDLGVFGTLRFNDRRTDDRRPGDTGGQLVLEVPIRMD